MYTPISQLVLVPNVMYPETCMVNPYTNIQYVKPSCTGSFYFDPITHKCEGILSMAVTGFCTKDKTPYFSSEDECNKTCVPSIAMDISHLTPPNGKDWASWTCKDKPCGESNNCVDTLVPFACFTAPCHQFKCYEPVMESIIKEH
ncbi:hypothetical protein BC833DRAFT_652867 [Globomyces pollinis-pini]|nr:hypothetical protein BC833DRAFT_652867 [Globomyces pollinis-pini]KAJ2991616.1 hypothetical protein HDV02_003666 [Globomyces sp. JEL0801]